MRLYKLEELVKDVLVNYEDSRSNDDVLIFRVYKEINEYAMIRELFCEIMLNRREYGLPSYKSIERCRRKVFEKHPELKPKRITKIRKNMEQEYKLYASNS